MGQHKESAADILQNWKGKGPCDIACRLCGVRVIDDAPDSMWQGYKPGLGGGFRVDEHESCDAIAQVMATTEFDTKLDAFFDGLGIDPGDRSRARRVLLGRLGHSWQLSEN